MCIRDSSILAERNRIRPWGLFGGRPGAPGEYLIRKPDGRVLRLRSKCTVKMTQGDILIVRTPGGGGYGDPYERDPSFVLRDVVDGLVSASAARRDYGVMIDEERMTVDLEATEELRRRRRRAAGVGG